MMVPFVEGMLNGVLISISYDLAQHLDAFYLNQIQKCFNLGVRCRTYREYRRLTYYNNVISRHFIDIRFFVSGSYIYYHN